jgi:hypothetical protein
MKNKHYFLPPSSWFQEQVLIEEKLFIPDPGKKIIPDPGVKKVPDPQYC